MTSAAAVCAICRHEFEEDASIRLTAGELVHADADDCVTALLDALADEREARAQDAARHADELAHLRAEFDQARRSPQHRERF
jgi:hypothetical protein